MCLPAINAPPAHALPSHLDPPTQTRRYITAMYWAYTTMTTVGYGDISSITVAEKVWAIVTMIGSGFFFSFVVGRMASVISKLDSVRSARGEELESITTFLNDVDLPRGLSKRVLDFFKQQQVKAYDRQKMLATLPFDLRSSILRHLYAGVISHVPLLQAMAHDEVFLTDVCVRLQQYTSPRDSFVYQRGERGRAVGVMSFMISIELLPPRNAETTQQSLSTF